MPALLITFAGKEQPHVLYVSAAFKSQEKARTWLSQAYEHEEWPEGFGSAPSQRTGSPDRLA
jgi:hypothetical protein